MKSLIDIQNLTLIIGTIQLLNGFSLKIKRGEQVGLTGPSGCGKTTLLRSIINGKPPKGSKFEQFNSDFGDVNITYAPQKNGLLPWYTVSKNFEILNSKKDKKLNLHKFTKFGIDSKFDSYPSELSGGEYQRVVLASAFLHEPELMIVDEPLTGVDINTKYKILQILYKYFYGHRDKSLLLVSHDVDVLMLLCDKIIFLNVASNTGINEISLIDKPKVKHIKELFEGEYKGYFEKKRNELMKTLFESNKSY